MEEKRERSFRRAHVYHACSRPLVVTVGPCNVPGKRATFETLFFRVRVFGHEKCRYAHIRERFVVLCLSPHAPCVVKPDCTFEPTTRCHRVCASLSQESLRGALGGSQALSRLSAESGESLHFVLCSNQSKFSSVAFAPDRPWRHQQGAGGPGRSLTEVALATPVYSRAGVVEGISDTLSILGGFFW